MMFSNVNVVITFPRRSLVFTYSSCEVSSSLSNVGGMAIGAFDLIKKRANKTTKRSRTGHQQKLTRLLRNNEQRRSKPDDN